MSDDSELAAIKAARLSQLKSQQGGGGRSSPSMSGSQNAQESEDASRQRQEEDQMRREMLATLLDNSARERCKLVVLQETGEFRMEHDFY